LTSVPTAALAAAARSEGIEKAAKTYDVSLASMRRAVDFEAELARRLAA